MGHALDLILDFRYSNVKMRPTYSAISLVPQRFWWLRQTSTFHDCQIIDRVCTFKKQTVCTLHRVTTRSSVITRFQCACPLQTSFSTFLPNKYTSYNKRLRLNFANYGPVGWRVDDDGWWWRLYKRRFLCGFIFLVIISDLEMHFAVASFVSILEWDVVGFPGFSGI